MAILDILKRKPKKEETKADKGVVEKKAKKVEIEKVKKEKPEVKPLPKPEKTKDKQPVFAYRVLKSPQITEKATALTEKNQYTFKIWPKANKLDVKKAVEGLYNVDVKSVKIVRVPARKRRLGRISGWRKGYKKAIVKIKEGQKIEIMPR